MQRLHKNIVYIVRVIELRFAHIRKNSKILARNSSQLSYYKEIQTAGY